MDREAWNERYRSADLVWGAEPNRFVEQELGALEPAGRALDLACGEGRNAIWLAQRGWEVTAVDQADVAIARARRLAEAAEVAVDWRCDDVTRWEPDAAAFALVIVSYLQIPAPDRREVLARAAAALAPGGTLFMIGHARRNLDEGTGGPRHASVLWDPATLREELEAAGLRVERCEEVLRPVEQDGGATDAIDVLALARRGSPRPTP